MEEGASGRQRAIALCNPFIVCVVPGIRLRSEPSGYDGIADILELCHIASMQHDIRQIALDWIAYARFGPENSPENVFANGWVLIDLVDDDATVAFETIKMVIRFYDEADLYSLEKTEAQQVVGLLAAGPLEDLLAAHGSTFIDAVEIEAGRDRRMAWALGGVWQFTTPDDIWARVQLVADSSYWERCVIE